MPSRLHRGRLLGTDVFSIVCHRSQRASTRPPQPPFMAVYLQRSVYISAPSRKAVALLSLFRGGCDSCHGVKRKVEVRCYDVEVCSSRLCSLEIVESSHGR